MLGHRLRRQPPLAESIVFAVKNVPTFDYPEHEHYLTAINPEHEHYLTAIIPHDSRLHRIRNDLTGTMLM